MRGRQSLAAHVVAFVTSNCQTCQIEEVFWCIFPTRVSFFRTFHPHRSLICRLMQYFRTNATYLSTPHAGFTCYSHVLPCLRKARARMCEWTRSFCQLTALLAKLQAIHQHQHPTLIVLDHQTDLCCHQKGPDMRQGRLWHATTVVSGSGDVALLWHVVWCGASFGIVDIAKFPNCARAARAKDAGLPSPLAKPVELPDG